MITGAPKLTALLGVIVACFGCAGKNASVGAGSDANSGADSARVQVAMWSGFEAGAAPLPPRRTALVVDSTTGMLRRTEEGVTHIRAARVAATRFVESTSPRDPLEVFVVAGEHGATCDAPLLAPLEGEREEVARQIGRLRARGQGSIGALLTSLADAPGELDRVVVITSLFDECGDDLCNAAAALADRGARLDVVAIGDFVAPECLATAHEGGRDGPPVPWTSERPNRFHIQTLGDDPAILNWGDVNGLPVEVRPGEHEIVVSLTPPLRVARRFTAGSRWKLEVLDFPSLEPPERQWRWQRIDVVPPAAGPAE